MPPPIHRRDFLRSAAALGVALPAWAQDAEEPRIFLRAADNPQGRPTMWLGAVTATSAVVKTKLPPGIAARLLVLKPGSAPLVFERDAGDDARSTVATFVLGGLDAGSLYTFTLEVAGKPANYPLGELRTFPPEGAVGSFAFAFGSCARTGSEHAVFRTIARRRPAFFLHLGDLHYVNISRDDRRLFRAAWDTVLSSRTQERLYRTVPLAYVWDDHDFGPNNSDLRSPSRSAARAVYREYAPHYPLAGEGAIYQAFSIARARFIVTDLRSERVLGKSLLGAEQKAWFFRELLAAARSHAVVFWASSVPWIGARGTDAWANYAEERREISHFIAQHRIANVVILCGDAHMLAADDGTNADYADGGGCKVRVLHGSALDQAGSYKGGPYSAGWHTPEDGEGCFGWVEVRDDGAAVEVAFTGRNQDDEVKVALEFAVG